MRLRNTSLWRTAISDNYFFRAAVAFAIMQASRRELLTPHGSRIVLAVRMLCAVPRIVLVGRPGQIFRHELDDKPGRPEQHVQQRNVQPENLQDRSGKGKQHIIHRGSPPPLPKSEMGVRGVGPPRLDESVRLS